MSGYNCKKCGYCCKTLFGFSNGWLKGLGLIKSETALFDREHIFPQLAIGVEKPEHVYLYQLALAICPHLKANNECSIYEKRPMICQTYPFQMVGFEENKISVSLKPECSQSIQSLNAYLSNGLSEEEIPAECGKMYSYIKKEIVTHHRRGSIFWHFDLLTKKWSRT